MKIDFFFSLKMIGPLIEHQRERKIISRYYQFCPFNCVVIFIVYMHAYSLLYIISLLHIDRATNGELAIVTMALIKFQVK